MVDTTVVAMAVVESIHLRGGPRRRGRRTSEGLLSQLEPPFKRACRALSSSLHPAHAPPPLLSSSQGEAEMPRKCRPIYTPTRRACPSVAAGKRLPWRLGWSLGSSFSCRMCVVPTVPRRASALQSMRTCTTPPQQNGRQAALAATRHRRWRWEWRASWRQADAPDRLQWPLWQGGGRTLPHRSRCILQRSSMTCPLQMQRR
mmetsp:Transcript_2211/g.4537  ORF Transcript_2211/g.4537 Transcript_2211/m.4537 type:complete len:202 (-) Transcript_2211:1512-2117(-)